jgi:hypothetical protein
MYGFFVNISAKAEYRLRSCTQAAAGSMSQDGALEYKSTTAGQRQPHCFIASAARNSASILRYVKKSRQ